MEEVRLGGAEGDVRDLVLVCPPGIEEPLETGREIAGNGFVVSFGGFGDVTTIESVVFPEGKGEDFAGAVGEDVVEVRGEVVPAEVSRISSIIISH